MTLFQDVLGCAQKELEWSLGKHCAADVSAEHDHSAKACAIPKRLFDLLPNLANPRNLRGLGANLV
jgi:hypothetical protein